MNRETANVKRERTRANPDEPPNSRTQELTNLRTQ